MPEWKLDESGGGVGPLRLGMSLDDIRRKLGTDCESFRRTPESRDQTLSFDESAVQVVVNENGAASGMLVFAPNDVTLAGIQLLGRRASEVAATLTASGWDFVACDVGLWSASLRVCLVEVEGLIDAVELGSSG